MNTHQSTLKTLVIFVNHCTLAFFNQTSIDYQQLYHDLLKIDTEDQTLSCLNQNQQISEVQTSKQQQSFNVVQQIFQSNLPIQHHIQLNQQIIEEPLQLQANKYKQNIKIKVNPRVSKFIKLQKTKTKQNKLKKQQVSYKLFEIHELKSKNLKKFELKEKLRKLNNQLIDQKLQLRQKSRQNSHDESSPKSKSFFENIDKSLLIKYKNRSFINENSLNNSTLKAKSDGQFQIRKIKKVEEIYTPTKHQAALHLIQKMHLQKLKKHQKLFKQMKLKQQKELQSLKKIEHQKSQEKKQIRLRQHLLQGQKNQSKTKKSILNKKLITQQRFIERQNPEQRQQINSVIFQEKKPQLTKNGPQNLYNQYYQQQNLNPITQEARQLLNQLRSIHNQTQSQEISDKISMQIAPINQFL